MQNQSQFNTIVQYALDVITHPKSFYLSMQKSGGYADPVIFVIVMAVITGLIFTLFSMFGAGMSGGMAIGLASIIVIPVFAIIGSFIGAAILFVIWKLMGSNENYETAYRCVAYSTAIYPIIAIIGLIPYLGTLVKVVWGFWLMIIASIEVHALAEKTTYLVFGILGAVMVLMNVASERAARQMSRHFEDLGVQMEDIGEQLKHHEEITPSEAGKAIGSFIKGMSGAVVQDDDNKQNIDENTPQQVKAQRTVDEEEPAEEMTPEEAGKALGDFFKGFEKAIESNK